MKTRTGFRRNAGPLEPPSRRYGEKSIRANARCLMVGQLASKQEILAARAQLNKMLTAGSSQTVPALDANPTRGLVLKAAA